jgi:hypothetical protein
MRRANCFYLALGAACTVLLLMAGCGKPDAGPKTIRADGVEYTACGGVLTVHSPREAPYDENPGTSEVLYEDPQGARHHLTKVRSLNIAPFKGDPAICTHTAQ